MKYNKEQRKAIIYPCQPLLIVAGAGTGKTTTLAKLAQLLKNNELTCVLACADTYRAGAIEQLIEHKFHSVRTSGEEMDYWMNVCCKLKSISPQDPRQVTLERVKNGIKSNIL